MRQPISSFIQERGLQSATASYSRTTRQAIYRVNNVNSPNRLVVSVFLCNFAVEITRKRMEQIAGRYINPYTDYGFKDDRRMKADGMQAALISMYTALTIEEIDKLL